MVPAEAQSMTRLRLIAAVLFVALAVVGCGGTQTAAEGPVGHAPSGSATDDADAGSSTEPSDTGSNSLSPPDDNGVKLRDGGH
jgi:hypothetical protein